MDSNTKNTYSYPNSDQFTDPKNEQGATSGEFSFEKRKTVSIIDALANSKKDTGDAQTVRTYQSDIANTIKNDNVSMIKVALSEKKRQERRGLTDEVSDETKQKNLYILIGVTFAFLVIAGLIAGFIYLQSKEDTLVQSNQQKVQQIFFTELTSKLNIDELNVDDLVKIIERDRDASMELGDMKSIVLTVGSSTEERKLTSSEFFSIIKSRVPDILVRSIDSDFLLGAYSFTPHDMFAVFRVNSYDAAFAGMLEWEPSIESDIGDLFITKRPRLERNLNTQNTTSNPNGVLEGNKSSTTQDTNLSSSPFGVLSQRRFVDRVVTNKDARVLVDQNGKDAMLYTFLDKETLVIATSERSLKEIVFRLTTGRIIR